MKSIAKKICLIGDFSVGKTSLIRCFVDRQFSDQYMSTVGVKISRKLVEVSLNEQTESRDVQLLIWDIEGQTQFKSIAPSYLQGANGAIVVGDLNRTKTIEHIKEHLDLVLSVNSQGLKIIVALNKSDIIKQEDLEKSKQLVQFQDCPQVLATYITSAKTGRKVDEMFQQLAHSMLKEQLMNLEA